MRYISYLFVLAWLLSSSCGQRCQNASASYLKFRGFDSTMLETVVIKHYGTNLALEDSSVFLLSSAPVVYYDSIEHEIIWPFSYGVSAGKYVIDIPGANRKYVLKDFRYSSHKSSTAYHTCYNTLESVVSNDDLVKIDGSIAWDIRQTIIEIRR